MWQILAKGEKTVNFNNFERVFKKKGNLYQESYVDISSKPLGQGPLETRGKSLRDVFE